MSSAPKILNRIDTLRALNYLDTYLKDKPNRKLATASLLGCSIATAARIANQCNRYESRLKIKWAIRICNALGKPIGRVIPTKGNSLKASLIGWRDLPSAAAWASQCDVGTHVGWVAHSSFGLDATYSCGKTMGSLTDVVVQVGDPRLPTVRDALVFRYFAGGLVREELWFSHYDNKGAHVGDMRATPENVTRQLAQIHKDYARHTSKIIRKFAARREEQSRRDNSNAAANARRKELK